MIFVLARTFEQLADQFVIAFLPFYFLGVSSIFILRRRPDYQPSFRVPLYPVVPLIFLASIVALLGNSLADESARLSTMAILGTVLLGVPVYYIRQRSTRSTRGTRSP